MKIALFRCCVTSMGLSDYEISSNEVLRELGIDFVDIREFNCCGYPLRNLNFKAYLLSSARNLALAEKAGLDILTICNCCHLDIEPDLRRKLLVLAGEVSRPDAARRRQVIKESRKRKGAERKRMLDEFDAELHASGIRELRRQPVFNTPNYFLPGEIPQETVDDPDFREAVESKHCYVCKEHYNRIHHFYDQLCPGCAAFNYAKRAELADLTGRVALLTSRRACEDRVPMPGSASNSAGRTASTASSSAGTNLRLNFSALALASAAPTPATAWASAVLLSGPPQSGDDEQHAATTADTAASRVRQGVARQG